MITPCVNRVVMHWLAMYSVQSYHIKQSWLVVSRNTQENPSQCQEANSEINWICLPWQDGNLPQVSTGLNLSIHTFIHVCVVRTCIDLWQWQIWVRLIMQFYYKPKYFYDRLKLVSIHLRLTFSTNIYYMKDSSHLVITRCCLMSNSSTLMLKDGPVFRIMTAIIFISRY